MSFFSLTEDVVFLTHWGCRFSHSLRMSFFSLTAWGRGFFSLTEDVVFLTHWGRGFFYPLRTWFFSLTEDVVFLTQRASGLVVKTTGLCHVPAVVQVLHKSFCDLCRILITQGREKKLRWISCASLPATSKWSSGKNERLVSCTSRGSSPT